MLKIQQAYEALLNSETVYIVSRREKFHDALYGAWIDDREKLRIDYSLITRSRTEAGHIGVEEEQECVLILSPSVDNRGFVYLLQDTPANRGYALMTAGGYTADGVYLLVVSPEPLMGSLIDGSYLRTTCEVSFVSPETLL